MLRTKRTRNPEAYRAARHERLRESLSIEEAFDGRVRSVRIRAAFDDFDGTELQTKWDRTRTSADKASFEEGCVADSLTWGGRRCLRGGFDFGGAICEAVSAHKHSVTGKVMCKGQRGQWTCRIHAMYCIDIDFAD